MVADTVTSASAVGGINLDKLLSSSNLATPINDGGGGNGEFLINGVAIDFNASTDTINSVLQAINDSAAGVTATFDASNNQFQLTNTTTGNVGISLQDVTGNFLAATGLSGGSLQPGTNLQYSVNGGGTLTSQSNTIDSSSSGITGLSVTALGAGQRLHYRAKRHLHHLHRHQQLCHRLQCGAELHQVPNRQHHQLHRHRHTRHAHRRHGRGRDRHPIAPVD